MVLAMILIVGAVLAMVLIENVSTLLMMIEQLECGNGLDRGGCFEVVDDDRATRMQTNNHNGVAVERGQAITITKWAMVLGHQQGTTRSCWTPETIQ